MKKRITKLAKAQDKTAHAFMLEAIREKLEAEETRVAFYAEAERRLSRMRKSAVGIAAEKVFAYLERRGKGITAPRPKPRKIP